MISLSRQSPRPALPLTALVIGTAALLLAGCDSAYYPQKGDRKPHPGVARAQNYPVHGIDIARYQGNVDWQAVKGAGTRFAYIKATEGGDYVDPMFQTNWQGAKAAGVPRGAYHFVYWCRPAHEQAQWFVQHIPNEPDALPPVLDLEWNHDSRTCPRKVPRELALEKVRLMLRELEQHTGKIPVIYTDITFHRDVLEGMSEFDRYPFWLRSVAAEPEQRYANRRWSFWQYTATGTVPGIRNAVDRNAFVGSEREFQGWMAGTYDPQNRVWVAQQKRTAPAPKPVEAAPLREPGALPQMPQPQQKPMPEPVETDEPAAPSAPQQPAPARPSDPLVTSSVSQTQRR